MKTRNIARLGAALLALCLCAAPALAAAPETGPWPGIEGEITKTLPFRDSTGDNTLVLTARETAGDDARSREIFAYLFRKDAGGAARRIWRVYDFVKDCEYHVDADFDESRVEITDLDKDGVSEIWLPYSLGCTSEVSPVEMKIIMYEGGQKHAMRGLSRDPWALNERRGGGTMDAAFRSGPAAFRDHARKLWKSIDDDYIQPYLLAEAERHPIADVRVDKRVLTCVVNGKPARLAFDADVPDLPVADGFTEVDFAVADVTGDGVDDLLVRVFIVGNTFSEMLSDGHVYEAKDGELKEALFIPANGFGRRQPKYPNNLGICPGPDGTLAIDASAGKFDDDGEAGTFLLVRQGGDWTVKDAPKGFECSASEPSPADAEKPAQVDSVDFSPAELKRMSTFVSNFTEVRFPNFDMKKSGDADTLHLGDDPSNPALVYFGIWHNYINNYKSRIKPCAEKDCTHGQLVMDAKFAAESVKKYFDIELKHRSVPRTDDRLPCHFDGTRYHFDGADGELVSYAKVTRAVREGDIIRMSGDLYQEDTNDIVGSFVVTAKPHKWNGKDTWAILSLKRERR